MSSKKQRSFIMKHQCFYSDFNGGKTSQQRRTNRRRGVKKMRASLMKLQREAQNGL